MAKLVCGTCGKESKGDWSDLCNNGCPVCGSGQVEIYLGEPHLENGENND